MKKFFLSLFLFFLLIPAFSLTFEVSYLTPGHIHGFTAGISTNNPLFNTSIGLYYDKHDFRLEHEYKEYYEYGYGQGGYWTTNYRDKKKTDTIIGPYLQFSWSFLPFNIGKSTKLGFNTSFQIAVTHSELANYELPLSGFLGLQGHFKDFDILTGLKATFYYHLNINDADFKENKNHDRIHSHGILPIIPVTVRYNFKRKTQTVTQQKQSRTHIINGSRLKPSL